MNVNSANLSAHAGSVARLLAGLIGGALASRGLSVDEGTLELVIGSVLVAAAGVWAIVKNVRASKAQKGGADEKGV
jgi:ABC-type nickel/cobalt efflux system permease component RcnA